MSDKNVTNIPSDNTDKEGLYEQKNSISEDKTKTSGPPPDYPPPPSPPDVYEMLDTETEIYSGPEKLTYQNIPATNKPKPKKKSPVAQKPGHFSPSKNPDDLQELRK